MPSLFFCVHRLTDDYVKFLRSLGHVRPLELVWRPIHRLPEAQSTICHIPALCPPSRLHGQSPRSTTKPRHSSKSGHTKELRRAHPSRFTIRQYS